MVDLSKHPRTDKPVLSILRKYVRETIEIVLVENNEAFKAWPWNKSLENDGNMPKEPKGRLKAKPTRADFVLECMFDETALEGILKEASQDPDVTGKINDKRKKEKEWHDRHHGTLA